MIRHVHKSCKRWGRQYAERREDAGFPVAHDLSELKGFVYQHDPKGLTEEAIIVSEAALVLMDARQIDGRYLVLISNYLFPHSAKEILPVLEMNWTSYWRYLQDAHSFILGYAAARSNHALKMTA